jgi:hypothetical protein
MRALSDSSANNERPRRQTRADQPRTHDQNTAIFLPRVGSGRIKCEALAESVKGKISSYLGSSVVILKTSPEPAARG